MVEYYQDPNLINRKNTLYKVEKNKIITKLEMSLDFMSLNIYINMNTNLEGKNIFRLHKEDFYSILFKTLFNAKSVSIEGNK